MDLGLPVAYTGLQPRTPVYSSDGHQVGLVSHVLAAEDVDVFDGIVIGEHRFGGHHRFADADDIESIHEQGVVLRLDQAACAALPEPSANPAVLRDDPAETVAEARHDRLRRAWDLLSGKR